MIKNNYHETYIFQTKHTYTSIFSFTKLTWKSDFWTKNDDKICQKSYNSIILFDFPVKENFSLNPHFSLIIDKKKKKKRHSI